LAALTRLFWLELFDAAGLTVVAAAGWAEEVAGPLEAVATPMPMTAVAPAAAVAAAILVTEAESLNTMDSLSRTVGRCCFYLQGPA
jgi:hypothetical protein